MSVQKARVEINIGEYYREALEMFAAIKDRFIEEKENREEGYNVMQLYTDITMILATTLAISQCAWLDRNNFNSDERKAGMDECLKNINLTIKTIFDNHNFDHNHTNETAH